jgi:hypothetical protein
LRGGEFSLPPTRGKSGRVFAPRYKEGISKEVKGLTQYVGKGKDVKGKEGGLAIKRIIKGCNEHVPSVVYICTNKSCV